MALRYQSFRSYIHNDKDSSHIHQYIIKDIYTKINICCPGITLQPYGSKILLTLAIGDGAWQECPSSYDQDAIEWHDCKMKAHLQHFIKKLASTRQGKTMGNLPRTMHSCGGMSCVSGKTMLRNMLSRARIPKAQLTNFMTASVVDEAM